MKKATKTAQRQLVINATHARRGIQTKFHGPTNHRGARVSARAGEDRVTVEWDHSKNPQENHARAAEAFIRKMGWDKYDGDVWVMGFSGDETGYSFVTLPKNRD